MGRVGRDAFARPVNTGSWTVLCDETRASLKVVIDFDGMPGLEPLKDGMPDCRIFQADAEDPAHGLALGIQ